MTLAVANLAMVLKIELVQQGRETVFMLIGRITSQDVQRLKAQLAEVGTRVALDLHQVRLVDLDAVHFLAEAEREGVELRRLPAYVRAWILLERPRLAEPSGEAPR